ncbi:MAG: sigma-70 family RNA polymerase sigma factor [Syntrophomonas sp.]|nr:sigma-70 family RNA polymerase sigma factor [Syntrophomonas sp.]
MQPDEERQYLQAFQKGDHRAVEILVDEYYPALLNFLLRMGCQPGDAEDIIQETFIKVARGLSRYQHKERFRTWLFKICHNNLRDYHKKASRRWEVPHDPSTLVTTEASCPESLMIEQEKALRVQAVLNQLPPKQRLVVVLRYYHEFSINEIAHLVQCPAGTVKSRLNGALNGLKDFMSKEIGNE